MRKTVISAIIVSLFLMLTASTCHSSEDGHEYITVKNNSNDTIYIVRSMFSNLEDIELRCNDSSLPILSSKELNLRSNNDSWEEDLSSNTRVLFFLDKKVPFVSEGCNQDTIEYYAKHHLKKKITLSKDSIEILEKNNWTIVYE